MGFAWNDLQGFVDLIVVDEKYRRKELVGSCSLDVFTLWEIEISVYTVHMTCTHFTRNTALKLEKTHAMFTLHLSGQTRMHSRKVSIFL